MSFIARGGGFLGRLRLCVGSGFAVGSVVAGLLLAAAVGPPAALASANLNWSTGTKVALPSDAAKSRDVEMHSVSCPSAGNCTAVGRYQNASADRLGLLLTEKLGKWTAAEATLPAGAASDPNPILTPVSCASAGNCTTVGYYTDTSGNRAGRDADRELGQVGARREGGPAVACHQPTGHHQRGVVRLAG